MYLYQIFGEESVKSLCGTIMSQEIQVRLLNTFKQSYDLWINQAECDKTGLQLVGRGKIIDFRTNTFTAGKPHSFEVEVELWPKITYSGPKGYLGLKVTVQNEDFDNEKYEQVSQSSCRFFISWLSDFDRSNEVFSIDIRY